MNSFLNYIQPSIIKASSDAALPNDVAGRYLINLNAVAIKYFQENFILTEDGDGNYLLKENYKDGDILELFGFVTEDSVTDCDLIDIPRVYVKISEKILNDDGTLQQFFISAIADNEIFGIGVEDFVPGVDYYINQTLYTYLVKNKIIDENPSIMLPNYIMQYPDSCTGKKGKSADAIIGLTEYFDNLSCLERDYSNLNYYYNKNKFMDMTFDEDALSNLYSTFASIILEYTQIDPDARLSNPNRVYELVLNWLKGFKSDCATVALNLILGTQLSLDTKTTGCGCPTSANGCASTNGAVSESYLDTKSCLDKYLDAMAEWVKKMLSDPNFYEDWFTIPISSNEFVWNETLVDSLITLLEEFLEAYGEGMIATDKRINCGCPTIKSNADDYRLKHIENYLKVLNWIKDCEMYNNMNKTKVYGSKFGEILPTLQF